jgi:hypothetical protein
MAEAGRITKGWIGVNLTDDELENLVEVWDFLNGHVDSDSFSKEWATSHRAAERVINEMEKAAR